jgi:chromosome segregation protein
VKLKKLIVQGFKSFKDRTTINFDQGITGIVGPNGCGKSNIVDALFWVMGEMSAKQLRGTSMKDVIFNGSAKYPPSAWAEVTLVLENEELKHIHIGTQVMNPQEIQLTRKLYRNGESEYRINSIPCRLKDIHEVFMDTGAGANSYSVIAQGEISQLVQAKPDERREMIEEVAGITKFKIRKKESLRKIEQTEQNLARLTDLKTEIEKNLKSLENQAQVAEKAYSLKEKIRRHELSVESNHVLELLKDIRDGKVFLTESQINLGNWRTRKNVLEISLQDERIKLGEQEIQIEEKQKQYNEDSSLLAGANAKLEYLQKSKIEKENQVREREKEIVEQEEILVERKTRLDVLNKDREQLLLSSHDKTQLFEAEKKLESSRLVLLDKEMMTTQTKRSLESKVIELTNVEQELFRNSSKLQEAITQLQDVNQEIESIEKRFSFAKTDIDQAREKLNTVEESAQKMMVEERFLKETIIQLAGQSKDSEKKYQQDLKDCLSLDARLKSLKELQITLAAGKEGAEDFLQQSPEGFQLLGSLIQCDEAYTAAVQALLEDLSEAVINYTGDWQPLIDWTRDNKEKGISCFIPSEVTVAEAGETLQNYFSLVTPLNSILRYPEEYQNIFNPMFDGLYIVGDLSVEKILTMANNLAFKAITSIDGKITFTQSPHGRHLRIGGQNNPKTGMIARNNLIAQLTEEWTQKQQQVEQSYVELNNLRMSIDEKRNAYELLRTSLNQLQTEIVAQKSQLENKRSQSEMSNTRLEILKNRKNEVSKNRLEYLEKEEALTPQTGTIKQEIEKNKASYESSQAEYLQFKSLFEKEKEELMRRQVEAQSWQQRLNSVEATIADVNLQIERYNQRQENNHQLIAQYQVDIESMIAEMGQLQGIIQELVEKVRYQEENLATMKESLRQLSAGMSDREDEVRKLDRSINKTEKDEVEYQMRLQQNLVDEEQAVRNVFEKYRVDLRQIACAILNYTPEDLRGLHDITSIYWMETAEGRKEITAESYQFQKMSKREMTEGTEKLRQYKNEYQELGDINWQAIEEYQKQKLRFNFLQDQERELRTSLEDLQNAIAQIDQRVKERFKNAFQEVNTRFEQVFPIIFGGGSAQLRLTSGIDDPECGVDIVAQPPGKKMQNINLMSGGEKAMTAVALIFSIFLVKPSPFCLLDEVDAPLDDANVERFNQLLREMSQDSQFILITHNKKTMEMNDTLYGVTMQEPGISKAVSVHLQ